MSNSKIPVNVGDSFLLDLNYGLHLHIVIAEESPLDSSYIMVVYCSSTGKNPDKTTIIEKGEHPFIDRQSWIRYQNVVICSKDEVRALIKKSFGKVTNELISKVQTGLLKSDKVSRRIKSTYNEWHTQNLLNYIK